jgi:hypothetical protein
MRLEGLDAGKLEMKEDKKVGRLERKKARISDDKKLRC